MNRFSTIWLAALLFIPLSGLSLNTSARIISVQGSNSPTNLSITSSARSQISWNVVEEPNAIGQAQISSTEGLFFGPSRENLLGRSSTLLSQTRSLTRDMNTTFLLRESLVIPQSVIRSALDRGFNEILYFRTFQDTPGGTSLGNFVTFSISANNAVSQVSLRQIKMEFDNGQASAIIANNTKLTAKAIISYQGSGLLEYRWEIASPPSTSGQPVFSPLMTRREFLMSGGQATISSPTLPTGMAGTYLLRLNILAANDQFNMPTLRYFVRSQIDSNEQQARETEIQRMTVSTPADGIKLTLKTQFVWQPMAGAKAYQVEFYSQPLRQKLISQANDIKPITGVIVPSTQTSLTMKQVSNSHLQVGASYFWRVIAIAENGEKVAASEFRSINY